MANGWTSARRAKQAQAIQTWRPWEQSTGPRTDKGKAQAAVNARRFHGLSPDVLAERDTARALASHVSKLLRYHSELLRTDLG